MKNYVKVISNVILIQLLTFTFQSLLLAQIAESPSIGDGTENNPYNISSIENLYWIAENSSVWDKHFIQTSDIDATASNEWNDGQGWISIGNYSNRFSGRYDGYGYTIKKLFINRPDSDYQGLFGFASGAILVNIGIIDATIIGKDYIGGIVGYNSSTEIKKCFSTGIISGHDFIGGLVGINFYSSILESYSKSIVSGNDQVGGLVGRNFNSSASDNYSLDSVNGENYVGGLIGFNSHSTIINSYSIGSTTGDTHVGGLVGFNEIGEVIQCYWNTETSGISVSDGGLGKTTIDLNFRLTFIDGGWYFKGEDGDETWNIGNQRNNGYPYHNWEYPDDAADDPPIVTTGDITNVSIDKATAAFTIINIGNPIASQHGICWSKQSNPTIEDSVVNNGVVTDAGKYTLEIKNLEPNTKYYVRAYVTNNNGTNYGVEINFYTLPIDPMLPVGLGTIEEPYLIESINNLFWIVQNPDTWDKQFRQTSDINAAGTLTWFDGKGWEPIGNNSVNFTGSYDGDNHIIDNLFINRSNENFMGFFGYSSGANISNMGITNIQYTGNNNVGAIVGMQTNNSIISKCYSSGNLNGTNNIGGLTGQNNSSTILNSYSKTDVNGGTHVGGLIGYNNGSTIMYTYSKGLIIGNSFIGGLIGRNVGTSNINNNFWDTQSSEQLTSAGGIGKTKAEMQTLSTYTNSGWPFKGLGADTVWNIGNSRNNGYPYFNWQFPDDPVDDPPVIITKSLVGSTSRNTFVSINIYNTGYPGAIEFGICWNTTGSPTKMDSIIESEEIIQPGDFDINVSHLELNSKYYVRAYISNMYGTNYGEEISFTTHPIEPVAPIGNGTSNMPYRIVKLENLYWLTINPIEWDKHYVQINDIDASITSDWVGGHGWLPIGNSLTPFAGTYDGGGFALNELFISRVPHKNDSYTFIPIPNSGNGDCQGLFGYIKEANISNLRVTNADISGHNYIGGITGLSENSVIINCYSSGVISGNRLVGGLVGRNTNQVSKSFSNCKVSGKMMVGGLIGLASGSINKSCFIGEVTGNDMVGGLAGFAMECDITNTFSRGSARSFWAIGGLVGAIELTNINYSYSAVSLMGDTLIGGLIGYVSVNQWELYFYNSFWDKDVAGVASCVSGPGKNTEEMKTRNTFLLSGWNFKDQDNEGIWSISENLNDGYPFLSWQEDIFLTKRLQRFPQINLYPNPFSNTFTIENAEKIQRIIVTTLLGQKILEVHNIENQEIIISAENMDNGIYLVILQDKKGMKEVRKIIKR